MQYINTLCGQSADCVTDCGARHHYRPVSVWNKPSAVRLRISGPQNSIKPSRAYNRFRYFKHTDVPETNFFSILSVLRYLSNLRLETNFISGIFVFELTRLLAREDRIESLRYSRTKFTESTLSRWGIHEGFRSKIMTERNNLKGIWEQGIVISLNWIL